MKKGIKALALIFAVSLLCSMLVFSTKAVTTTADYTRPGATSSSKLTSADILEIALGIELGEAERKYLELHGEYEIIYASHIPTSYVTVGYSSDTRVLVVEAKSYSYTSKSGVVEWEPVSVAVGNNEKDLEPDGDSYKAVFEGVEEGSDAVARVKYSTKFTVTAAAINRIVNQAYEDAEKYRKTISEKAAEYERLLLEYDKSSEKYEKYLAELESYNAELALYEAYLADKRKYDDEYKEYKEYLERLEAYEELCEEYEQYKKSLEKFASDYALYEKYLKEKDEYPEKLAAYTAYAEKCDTVKKQLAIMDGMKTFVTSYRRSLYLAIIGTTVTEVLQNSDTLTSSAVGVDAAVIEKAENATIKIREIYEDYFALTEEKDKYSYYCANYESIRDNFTALLQALDKMYQNPKVRTAINNRGPDMQPKFEILLAQLYYAVNALSDFSVPNYGNNYKVNSTTEKTPLQVLDGKPYMTDTNSATPLDGGYPVTVNEPTLPEEVAKPEEVAYMAEPIAPATVKNPGSAPEEIKKPTLPTAVKNPGAAPTPYSPPERVPELISAYERSELSPRREVSSSKKLFVSISVEKSIFNQESCSVEFRDTDGTLLEAIVIDKNSFAEYTGQLPEREEDAAASYTFAGWADKNGVPVDLTSVEKSIEVYPYFIPTYKSYQVSWNVDGFITTETLIYGELPQYSGIPTRPSDGNVEYEFAGWDKPVLPLTQNTTYTAIFTPRYLVSLPDGGAADVTRAENGDYTVDLGDTPCGGVSLSLLLERAASKGALTIKSEGYTVSLAFSEVMAMRDAGVDRISIEVNARTDSYSFKLNMSDADGRELTPDIRSTLTVPTAFSDLSKVKVYSLGSDGERVSVSHQLLEASLTVVGVPGTEYYAVAEYEYAVILLPNDTVSITVGADKALVGEWVEVTVETPNGVALDGAYYIVGSDEDKVYFTDGGFTMPDGNVSVGVDFHEIIYVIQFVSDGKVLLSEEYRYGETPTPPASPKKTSDGEYTYTFVGWSSEIAAVTEDAVYEAVYEAAPIPKDEGHDGFYATPGVWKIIIALGVLSVYIFLVILPCIVIITVKLVLYKKRKRRKNSRKT